MVVDSRKTKSTPKKILWLSTRLDFPFEPNVLPKVFWEFFVHEQRRSQDGGGGNFFFRSKGGCKFFKTFKKP